MLDALITSKTRVKLLMKFFLNPLTHSYLRELALEFNESTNGIRIELSRFEDAGLLSSKPIGRTKQYWANTDHSLFNELNALVEKYMGVDKIIDKLVKKLGHVESAYIIGDYAKGLDTGIIDIVLIGVVDIETLSRISDKRGKEIGRKVRTLVLTKKELAKYWDHLEISNALLIWGSPVSKK